MCYGLKRPARLPVTLYVVCIGETSGFGSIPPPLRIDRIARDCPAAFRIPLYMQRTYSLVIFPRTTHALPLRGTIYLVKTPRNHHRMYVCVCVIYTVCSKTNCRHLYFPKTSLDKETIRVHVYTRSDFRAGKSLVFFCSSSTHPLRIYEITLYRLSLIV